MPFGNLREILLCRMWLDYFSMVYENITVAKNKLKNFTAIRCVINTVLCTPLFLLKAWITHRFTFEANSYKWFKYLFYLYPQKKKKQRSPNVQCTTKMSKIWRP